MRAIRPTAESGVRKIGMSGLPAIHPDEFLREILDELGLTQAAFADAIGISPVRVSHMLRGDRPVTAEVALRLGLALGQTPQYWLNLQTTYDLKRAQYGTKLGRAALDNPDLPVSFISESLMSLAEPQDDSTLFVPRSSAANTEQP